MFERMNSYGVVLAIILVVSFVAYGWAIKKHFSVPKGAMDPRMRSLAVAGAVTFAVHLLCMLTTNVTSLRFYAAMLTGVSGLLIFAIAIRSTRTAQFALAFSDEQPGAIVTTGPYAWFRHPFYTAYSLTWLMGVVSTLHVAAIISTAIMICFYLSAARGEEKLIMDGPSASTYLDYRSKTGMFWPKLR